MSLSELKSSLARLTLQSSGELSCSSPERSGVKIPCLAFVWLQRNQAQNFTLCDRHFVNRVMASLPSPIYLHLEALLLLVTEDVHSLHPALEALKQQSRCLPTKRAILVGLSNVRPETAIHTPVFPTKANGSSIISPGFYRDLSHPSRERAGWESCYTHVFNHAYLHCYK